MTQVTIERELLEQIVGALSQSVQVMNVAADRTKDAIVANALYAQAGITHDTITSARAALQAAPAQEFDEAALIAKGWTLQDCKVCGESASAYVSKPAQPVNQVLVDALQSREAFERHWVLTRGPKKAGKELKRHPLQPQCYIQDSANRHWVTWQAAQAKQS